MEEFRNKNRPNVCKVLHNEKIDCNVFIAFRSI